MALRRRRETRGRPPARTSPRAGATRDLTAPRCQRRTPPLARRGLATRPLPLRGDSQARRSRTGRRCPRTAASPLSARRDEDRRKGEAREKMTTAGRRSRPLRTPQGRHSALHLDAATHSPTSRTKARAPGAPTSPAPRGSRLAPPTRLLHRQQQVGPAREGPHEAHADLDDAFARRRAVPLHVPGHQRAQAVQNGLQHGRDAAVSAVLAVRGFVRVDPRARTGLCGTTELLEHRPRVWRHGVESCEEEACWGRWANVSRTKT